VDRQIADTCAVKKQTVSSPRTSMPGHSWFVIQRRQVAAPAKKKRPKNSSCPIPAERRRALQVCSPTSRPLIQTAHPPRRAGHGPKTASARVVMTKLKGLHGRKASALRRSSLPASPSKVITFESIGRKKGERNTELSRHGRQQRPPLPASHRLRLRQEHVQRTPVRTYSPPTPPDGRSPSRSPATATPASFDIRVKSRAAVPTARQAPSARHRPRPDCLRHQFAPPTLKSEVCNPRLPQSERKKYGTARGRARKRFKTARV